MMIILRVAVQAYLSSFNNKFYSQRRPCPRCGSKNVVKRGTETRLFCKLIIEDGFVDVKVRVKRLQCKSCGANFYAEAPFYENCLYSTYIVDLCLALAANMPYNRAEKLLMELGIQVDRGTIENYCKLFWERAEKYAGLSFLGAGLAINVLKILTGVENVEKLREKFPGLGEVVAGVADETYPTKKGAKKRHREENKKREREGKRPPPYPEGFTIATAYLPALKIFASLCVQDMDFNYLLAFVLMEPLKGTDYNITDGCPSYNGTCSNLKRCIIHRRRRIANKDPEIRELKRRDPNAYLEKYKALYEQLKEDFRREVEKIVGRPPPEGLPTSTNSIEGGNWRIKYFLATLYWTHQGLRGRVLLMCLRDSLKTFSGGRPVDNPVVRMNHFNYGLIMTA